MEVKIIYCKPQLEAAVDWIAKYNPHFLGQKDYIRKAILDDMKQIALDPEQYLAGTMGYTLWGDRSDEGIDSDENLIDFAISIDPSLGLDLFPEDFIEEVVND